MKDERRAKREKMEETGEMISVVSGWKLLESIRMPKNNSKWLLCEEYCLDVHEQNFATDAWIERKYSLEETNSTKVYPDTQCQHTKRQIIGWWWTSLTAL